VVLDLLCGFMPNATSYQMQSEMFCKYDSKALEVRQLVQIVWSPD